MSTPLDALTAATLTLTKRIHQLEKELENVRNDRDQWKRAARKWEARTKANHNG